MEPIIAGLCLFVMTGGIAFYEHEQMMKLVKIAENKERNVERRHKQTKQNLKRQKQRKKCRKEAYTNKEKLKETETKKKK